MDPWQSQRTTRRIAPLDLLVLIFLVGLVGSGVYLILRSHSKQATATSSGVPVVSEVAGKPVEAVDSKKPVSVDNPQAIKDELLVTIPNKTDTTQFGDKIQPIDGLPNTYRLIVEGSGALSDKRAEVAKKPGVEGADPNYVMLPAGAVDQQPTKPVVKFDRWQWGVDRVDARPAWGISQGGGTIVAILDTGVRTDHVEFKDGIDNNHVISFVPKGAKGDNCTSDGNPRSDTWGHGTAVASIVTSAGNAVNMAGIAPHAKIMPVQVLGCSGGTDEWVAKGIRYAADNGADVINMSFGADIETCSKVETSAVSYAISKGVVVVAASGNSKTAIGCPARIPGVIAVGAIDRYNNLTNNKDWGSNFGPQQSVVGPGIDIAAACACVGQGNDRYVLKFNGTSAAAPFVSGVAALMKSVNPGLRPGQVKDYIQRTATDPRNNQRDSSLPNNQFGYGIVDAYRAVNFVKQNTGGGT